MCTAQYLCQFHYFIYKKVIMFQSIIISFLPRQWPSVTRYFGQTPYQILGIPPLPEPFLTTKTKKGKKKEVEGVWEIQAYYTHRYCSPISSSLITDFHSPTFPGAAFSGTGYLYTASYLTDLKQLLTNGLFQQDASCVWFNSVYIYVTESNQVGLCAVTIMFAQLHLGRKALPLQY